MGDALTWERTAPRAARERTERKETHGAPLSSMSGRLQINTALTMVQEAAAAASQPVGSPGEPEQAAELNATTPRAHDNLDAAWSASPARPARQMARKYWQPDSEAFECAIAGCGTQFSSRNLFSGRHHCRACGRVVCAECSLGTVRPQAPPSPFLCVLHPVRNCKPRLTSRGARPRSAL